MFYSISQSSKYTLTFNGKMNIPKFGNLGGSDSCNILLMDSTQSQSYLTVFFLVIILTSPPTYKVDIRG